MNLGDGSQVGNPSQMAHHRREDAVGRRRIWPGYARYCHIRHRNRRPSRSGRQNGQNGRYD